MQAKDIMTQDVITIDPEMDVMSTAKILLNHRISAVLVVDEHGLWVSLVRVILCGVRNVTLGAVGGCLWWQTVQRNSFTDTTGVREIL
jgi:CBS domain-containing protein